MASKKQNNLLLLGALAAGGYYLYSKQKGADVAAEPLTPAETLTPLAPMTGTGGGGGAPLQPNYTTPTPGAVGTPYGPVIPSNFDTMTPVQRCRSLNPTWSETQCSTRLKEILFRYQYIVNSIRNAQEFIASGQAANQLAQVKDNIAALETKKREREAEYLAFTREPLPAGTINTPEKVAEYKAFLSSQGWCDPFVGILCPGYNYGTTPQTTAVTPVVTPPTTPVVPTTPTYDSAQKDVIFRHQYIVNSIRAAQAFIASGQAANQLSQVRANIAALEVKRQDRLRDWAAFNTTSIPSADAVSIAEYKSFLAGKGWCDPYVGIPCPGWNP